MLLETFIPVIQTEIVMPFSGFTARAGEGLNIYLVIIVGIIGSELGALTLYGISRMFSDEKVIAWVGKYGKWFGFSEQKLRAWSEKFKEHRGLSVLIGRLIPGVRGFIAVPAGLMKMPLWEFALFNAVGTVVWVSGLAMLGYVLGNSYGLISRYSSIVTYGFIGITLAYMVYSFVQYKNTK